MPSHFVKILLPAFRSAPGSDFHPTVGLILAGGWYSSSNVLDNKVFRSQDYGVTFEALPNLPDKRGNGCLVIVDEDEIIRLGG